jgi:hypothetical protein
MFAESAPKFRDSFDIGNRVLSPRSKPVSQNLHSTDCPLIMMAIWHGFPVHKLNIIMYDLELSRRHCIIKSSRATSRVNSFRRNFRTLRTRAVMALETSVSSFFNQLTRLVAREDFIKHNYVLTLYLEPPSTYKTT